MKKQVSILFVTEDRKQPFSFRMPLRLFKSLVIGFSLFLILVLIGGISYWMMFSKVRDYEDLSVKYAQSLQYNKRVQYLMERLSQIEEIDQRVRKILGVKLNLKPKVNVVNPKEKNGESGLASGTTALFASAPPLEIPSGLSAPASPTSIPTLLPVDGFITQEYRWESSKHVNRHVGIDIAAKENSVIQATADGFIIFANATSDGGHSLIVDHLNGFLTYYKHNNRLLVSAGDFVKQGTPIALLGNSGHSSAPHLHYEVWKDGVSIDPNSIIMN